MTPRQIIAQRRHLEEPELLLDQLDDQYLRGVLAEIRSTGKFTSGYCYEETFSEEIIQEPQAHYAHVVLKAVSPSEQRRLKRLRDAKAMIAAARRKYDF